MKTKNSSIRQLAAFTTALCVAGGASAAGNLVVNGDFESPAVLLNGIYQCFSNSGFQNWTSAGTHGSCFIQQNTDAWGSAYSGTKLMYVNDFGDTGTQLSQLLTLIAGTTYKLSFEVSGLKGRTGSVGLGVDLGTDHHAVAAPSGGGWTGFSYDYTAGTSGATSLKFTATSGPVNIDAVSVVALPAVPEPESWAMMLAGLGAIGLVARRRA